MTMECTWIEKMDGILSKHSIQQENGCCLWTGQAKESRPGGTKYGVVNVRFPGSAKWTKVYAHRLAFMLHFHILEIEKNMHISHLCHSSLCVNHSHLSKEPPLVNNQRRMCVNEGICITHEPYARCMLDL